MEEEIWRDVVGFEGLYQVSNMGSVRSCYHVVMRSNGRKRTVYPVTLKPQKSAHGYFMFNLSKNGKGKTIVAHRIVAIAFIPNPENKPQVNHKDGNKKNNHVSNLEWMTSKENINHSWMMGMSYTTHAGKFGDDSYKKTAVIQSDTSGVFIEEHQSIIGACNKLGLHPSSIINCCKGRRPNYGGFNWEYKMN